MLLHWNTLDPHSISDAPPQAGAHGVDGLWLRSLSVLPHFCTCAYFMETRMANLASMFDRPPGYLSLQT